MRRFQSRGVERDDLFQQGVEGLIKAKNTFDPTRGTQFSTWAVPIILGHMRRACDQAPPVHVPRTDREKWRGLMGARAALYRQMGREPTSGELCAALRMPASEFVQLLTLGNLRCQPVEPSVLAQAQPSFEDALLLGELIDHLQPPLPRLVRLRWQGRLTQRQTAQVLGLSQGQVSKLEKKAAAQLKDLLAEC